MKKPLRPDTLNRANKTAFLNACDHIARDSFPILDGIERNKDGPWAVVFVADDLPGTLALVYSPTFQGAILQYHRADRQSLWSDVGYRRSGLKSYSQEPRKHIDQDLESIRARVIHYCKTLTLDDLRIVSNDQQKARKLVNTFRDRQGLPKNWDK